MRILMLAAILLGPSVTVDTSTRAAPVAPVVGGYPWAKSGCCSWHGGVCGCRDGRALCCDGALSPSCGC